MLTSRKSRTPIVVTSLLSSLALLSISGTSAAGLRHHWKLDETSGTTATSSTSTAVTGTLGQPSAAFGTGLLDNGVTITPTGQHDLNANVQFPGSVAAFGTGDFSVSFWYRTSFVGMPNAMADVLGNRTNAGQSNYLSIRMNGSGTLEVEVIGGTSPTHNTLLEGKSVKVNDGAWHHIVVTRDGAFVRLYVDGAEVDLGVSAPANLDGAKPFRLGRSLTVTDSQFHSIAASYDDVRINDDAAGPHFVHQLFELGPTTAVSGLVKKFAPALRFDHDANTFPMSAQHFYEEVIEDGDWDDDAPFQNNDPDTLEDGVIPTYYQVTRCGLQFRINYWWFYGYQHQPSCSVFGGDHPGDWEHVMVTLSDSMQLAAVTYYQHKGRYTRLRERDGFGTKGGTHPIVYAGKTAHGSYHNQGGNGTCLYFDDWRNYDGSLYLDTWDRLVNLELDSEPWMAEDRIGGFTWGEDGTDEDAISTHPTQKEPSCEVKACADEGCSPSYSQCKPGDDQDLFGCWVPCKSGYTDMGLTCTNWSIDSLHTYNQKHYDRDYLLPLSDPGLVE